MYPGQHARLRPLQPAFIQLGRQMAEASKPMEELGRKMAELGREQARISRDADKTVRSLIQEALQNGQAKPVR